MTDFNACARRYRWATLLYTTVALGATPLCAPVTLLPPRMLAARMLAARMRL